MPPRKRKPAALKILQGNPGHRPVSENAPQFTPGAPPCPDWLGKVARVEWDRIVPELDAKGLITQADLAALAGYCEVFAELQEHTLTLRKAGRYYDSGTGVIREHPASRARRECLLRLGSYMAMLGMTPADRSKVTAAPKPTGGKLEELLKYRGRK